MEQSKSIKEILDTYGKYTGLTMGTSMKPLIHEQRDNIIVVKNKGRLKKYDVPVYVQSRESILCTALLRCAMTIMLL